MNVTDSTLVLEFEHCKKSLNLDLVLSMFYVPTLRLLAYDIKKMRLNLSTMQAKKY